MTTFNHRQNGVLLLLFAATVFVGPVSAAELRTWTSADGKFSTEARLVDYSETSVRLKKADDVVVAVPLKKLSAVDLRHLGSAGNHYRVDGAYSIPNPIDGVGWKVFQRTEIGGFRSVVLSTDKPLDEVGFSITVVPQPVKTGLEEEEKRGIAMLYDQELMAGLKKSFPMEAGQNETRKRDGKLVYGATAAYRRPDGSALGVMTESVFKGSTVFHVQVLFIESSKLTAAKLLEIGEDIKQL